MGLEPCKMLHLRQSRKESKSYSHSLNGKSYFKAMQKMVFNPTKNTEPTHLAHKHCCQPVTHQSYLRTTLCVFYDHQKGTVPPQHRALQWTQSCFPYGNCCNSCSKVRKHCFGIQRRLTARIPVTEECSSTSVHQQCLRVIYSYVWIHSWKLHIIKCLYSSDKNHHLHDIQCNCIFKYSL